MIQSKTSTWSAVNFRKLCDLYELKNRAHNMVMWNWSADTLIWQVSLVFIMTWMSHIKDVWCLSQLFSRSMAAMLHNIVVLHICAHEHIYEFFGYMYTVYNYSTLLDYKLIIINSGAVAALDRHNYRKRTTCMHRNRKPCNSFFMVNMVSGMDCRRMSPTRKKTMSHNRAANTPANKCTKSCSQYVYRVYIFDIGQTCY